MPLTVPAALLRLLASVPEPLLGRALDLAFGKPDPIPEGWDPACLQPASFPPDYRPNR